MQRVHPWLGGSGGRAAERLRRLWVLGSSCSLLSFEISREFSAQIIQGVFVGQTSRPPQKIINLFLSSEEFGKISGLAKRSVVVVLGGNKNNRNGVREHSTV